MRRSLILLGTAVLLCTGCAGNAGNDAEEPARSTVTQRAHDASTVRAAVAATSGSTARIEEQIELRNGGTTYVLSVTGSFDLAKDKGRLAVDLPGGAISHMDEIFAGDTVYLRGVNGLDDAWGSMARDRAEAHFLLRAPLNDPEHVLRQVAAMQKVSRLGEENVNGVPAVHYRGTLDHQTLTLRLATGVRTKADAMRDALGSEIPVFADAWVDGKGRVVRVGLSYTGMASVTVTMTLSDVGKPVTAVAPAPGRVLPVVGVTGVLPG